MTEWAGADLARVRESGVFIVDDVAFIHPEHGHAIADKIERRKIRKQYYLETRGDVLLRNKEVFTRWKKLGLEYMFLGLEAVDDEGLKRFRKRVSLVKSQQILNRKHLGWAALRDTFWHSAKLLAKGQTNFVRMLWKFSSVYNPQRQMADHAQPNRYEMRLPESPGASLVRNNLYVHPPEGALAIAQP